jgi:CPA2 family monovalent cation:H+ antiporter-2
MFEITFLREVVLIFLFSVVSLYICHRLKLPAILGFLVTGLVIGPYGLGFIESIHQVDVLSEVGVVLLLFTIGIEFSLTDLLRSKRAIFLGGTLQVMLTITATFVIMHFLDMAYNKALFIGFLVALSSTAIVLKTLQDRGELDSAQGRVTLSILIFQDIVIAPMMIFTPLIAGGAGDFTYSIIALLIKGIAVVAIVVLLARYVVPKVLFQLVRTRSREIFLLSTVLICFAVAWLTNNLGLSLGLGAFLAGLVISQSEYSHQALEGVLPFKVIFTSFFFVSIGMLLDISLFTVKPLLIIAVTLIVLTLKLFIASSVGLMLGMSSRAAIIVGFSVFQVGEFSFILMKEGLSLNLLDDNIYQLFLAVSILTMAITPFAIEWAPKFSEKMSQWPGLKPFRGGSYRWLGVERAVRTLNDHLVVIGFGINGRNIARAAQAAKIPYTIIESNPDTVRVKRAEGEPIIYGDATSRDVLRHAVIAKARIVVVAISDAVATRRVTQAVHNSNPAAYLIVRTRFVAETQALIDLGANEVIPEEFETSVEIFTRVLGKYLIPRDEIESFTAEIRAGSYSMFRTLSSKAGSFADLKSQVPEIEIQSIKISENSAIAGKTLTQAQIRSLYGVSVVAIMSDSKIFANPPSDQIINVGDVLYVVGTTDLCAKATRAIA